MRSTRVRANPAGAREGVPGIGGSGSSRRIRSATPLLVAVLLLLHLAPIWAFDYFPSQDGAAHLHNAKVIEEYDRPERTAYREYYAVDIQPIPNLIGHLTLAGLMLAAPPRIAEKIFLSLYVLLLSASLLYGLRALDAEPSFAWVLPFPLIYNFPLHMGFYSFSLGVPISFFAIGYVLASRDRFGLQEASRLALLLFLLYFAHLLALLLTLIAIAIITARRINRAAAAHGAGGAAAHDPLGDALRQHGFMPCLASVPAAVLAASYFLRGHFLAWVATVSSLLLLSAALAAAAWLADRTHSPASRWSRALLGSPAVPPLVACLPALLALAVIKSGSPLLGPGQVSAGPDIVTRLGQVWALDALVSFGGKEVALSIAVAGIFLVVALYLAVAAIRRRHRDPGCDGLGWVVLALGALYFVTPNGVIGGGYILPRIALYILLASILWLGCGRLTSLLDRAVQWSTVFVAVAFLGLRSAKYAELNRQLAAYVSAAEQIDENTTLLSLTYAPHGLAENGTVLSERVKPFIHAAGYIAAEKGLVLLNNYEASLSYFPVRYRPPVDPSRYFGNVLYPGRGPLDLLSYPERTGGRVDYVLVWGLREDALPGPVVVHTLAQLEAGYDRIRTDPGRALGGLYRWKETKDSREGLSASPR